MLDIVSLCERHTADRQKYNNKSELKRKNIKRLNNKSQNLN